MLKPSECFAGPFSAATGMTLVLPRGGSDCLALIVVQGEQHVAIMLTEAFGGNRFVAFKPDDRWHGLHVPGVEIELDETSIYDANGYQTPLGSMVRQDDKLFMTVHWDGNPRAIRSAIAVYEHLPPCVLQETACFRRWQVVLGSGDDKRVLHEVNSGAAVSAS